MKVMMFVKATKQTEAGQTEEALLAMHKFNEDLQKAGVLPPTRGLPPLLCWPTQSRISARSTT